MYVNTLSRKILCVALLVTSGFCTIKPLSQKAAATRAALGALLIGTGAAVGTYCLAFDNHSNQTHRQIGSILAGVVTTGVSTHLLYKWLYAMTPEARIVRAKVLINNALNDSLVSQNFETLDALVIHATARFGTSWPVIKAAMRYRAISLLLELAQEMLSGVYQETQTNPDYFLLAKECEDLSQVITDAAKIVQHGLSVLPKHEKYGEQEVLFKKYMQTNPAREREILCDFLASDDLALKNILKTA